MKPKTKTVLEIGQIVYIGNKDNREICGEITAVCVRKESVKYEITWWKDDSRKSEWVLESEITTKSIPKKTNLGFYSSD